MSSDRSVGVVGDLSQSLAGVAGRAGDVGLGAAFGQRRKDRGVERGSGCVGAFERSAVRCGGFGEVVHNPQPNTLANRLDNANWVGHTRNMTTTAPEIGRKVQATTTTATAQTVLVEVTAIESETDSGWFVYGYRAHRGARPRQTMYPRLYFVPKVSS